MEELTTTEWRLVRQTLKIILRQDKHLRESKEVHKALASITDEVNRELFEAYFIKGFGIIKCTFEFHYEEKVVRRKLQKATKDFSNSWHDGALIRLFNK